MSVDAPSDTQLFSMWALLCSVQEGHLAEEAEEPWGTLWQGSSGPFSVLASEGLTQRPLYTPGATVSTPMAGSPICFYSGAFPWQRASAARIGHVFLLSASRESLGDLPVGQGPIQAAFPVATVLRDWHFPWKDQRPPLVPV